MTDQDCELSFNVGQLQITIEIAKDEQEKAIQVYRTLVHLSMVQQQNLRLLNFSKALPPININCAGGQGLFNSIFFSAFLFIIIIIININFIQSYI